MRGEKHRLSRGRSPDHLAIPTCGIGSSKIAEDESKASAMEEPSDSANKRAGAFVIRQVASSSVPSEPQIDLPHTQIRPKPVGFAYIVQFKSPPRHCFKNRRQ